jgi:hypothetical protein
VVASVFHPGGEEADMARRRIVPSEASTADVEAAIADPVALVYLTFGTRGGAAWKVGVWSLGEYAKLELFLLDRAALLAELANLPSRETWRTTEGLALGGSAPKGLFVARDGKAVLVLTGRQAEQWSVLQSAKRQAQELGAPTP